MKEEIIMITDLTEGKPSSVLVKFSLPMLWSAMFQQLYNISDSIIAGKFAGEDALAAIGASYPITQIFTAIALGCNVGASVVISQNFGAKKYTEMKTAINTSYISFGILSIILTFIGIFFSGGMLSLLKTPENIFSSGVTYLNIYSGGMFFVFMYNICTGIFTALGDSKTPLYLLIASSVGNILLDLLFVAVWQTGVAGAAWATFIAQAIAAAAAFALLTKRMRAIKSDKPQKFSASMLKVISFMSIPSILQQSFVSVGNLFIQVLVNGFGSSVIAGYSAAIKLNTFAITSFTTLGNGLSNFTAQNIGAQKYDRVPKGFKAGVFIGLCVAVPVSLLYFIGGKLMLGLFMEDGAAGAAMDAGLAFLHIVSPFYAIVCLKLAADGLQRGAGKMFYFMISTFTDLILRVILAFVLVGPFDSKGIWLSWPVGWCISTAIALFFYCTGKWRPKETLEDKLEEADIM